MLGDWLASRVTPASLRPSSVVGCLCPGSGWLGMVRSCLMDDPSSRCADPWSRIAGSSGVLAAPLSAKGQGSRTGRSGPPIEYSLGRLRGEIADHHHALDWALWKWGHRRGGMTKGELAAALRGISRRE